MSYKLTPKNDLLSVKNIQFLVDNSCESTTYKKTVHEMSYCNHILTYTNVTRVTNNFAFISFPYIHKKFKPVLAATECTGSAVSRACLKTRQLMPSR